MKSVRFVVLAAGVIGAIGALAPALRAQEAGIAVGSMAPSAMVHTLDGKAVDLKSLTGKQPVVMEFWATWCPLCKQLEPAMQAAKTRHANDVTFVGVTVANNQSPEKAKEFVEKNGMKGVFVFDTDGAAVKAFSTPHTSFVVVIDKHGRVVYTGVGGTQDLEAAIAKAQ